MRWPEREAKPLLVIVSGPPATGKTTLARRLSAALGLALLAKDDVKEMLAEVAPPRSVDESRKLGAASFQSLFRLGARFLDSGIGLILEANFSRGLSEVHLEPLVKFSCGVLVHLSARPDESFRRYRERFDRGERHWAHFDGERAPFTQQTIPAEIWERIAEPLALDVPTLVVDTTQSFVDEIEPILDFVWYVTAGATVPPTTVSLDEWLGGVPSTSPSPLGRKGNLP